MDIFNKNKIAELEEIIRSQEEELKIFREMEEKRKSKKHVTGIQCIGCKNLLTRTFEYNTHYICKLDIECKERKEE